MAGKDQYSPDVYKRLELVRKQFQRTKAESKKPQSAERQRRILGYFEENKVYIIRTTMYVVLTALVFSIIWMVVMR